MFVIPKTLTGQNFRSTGTAAIARHETLEYDPAIKMIYHLSFHISTVRLNVFAPSLSYCEMGEYLQ